MAISSEPLDSLTASVAKLSAKESIGFPLAADPELTVFKAYRAYDDFENMPLHAHVSHRRRRHWCAGTTSATSLSPTPKFLLEEAKRLLGRP